MTRGPAGDGALRDWLGFFGRRLLQGGLFVLWAAFTLVFVVLYLLPSDPIKLMLSGSGAEFASVDDATLEQLRASTGWTRPPRCSSTSMLSGTRCAVTSGCRSRPGAPSPS